MERERERDNGVHTRVDSGSDLGADLNPNHKDPIWAYVTFTVLWIKADY